VARFFRLFLFEDSGQTPLINTIEGCLNPKSILLTNQNSFHTLPLMTFFHASKRRFSHPIICQDSETSFDKERFYATLMMLFSLYLAFCKNKHRSRIILTKDFCFNYFILILLLFNHSYFLET